MRRWRTGPAWSPSQVSPAGFSDLHPGRFGPVGAAFLGNRIWPQLVGPDIGCGMALWRLDLPRHRLKIDRAVRRLAGLDDGPDPDHTVARLWRLQESENGSAPKGWAASAAATTCEVQAVEEVSDPDAISLRPGDLCLPVHSGSRGRDAQIFEGLDKSWEQGYAPESEAARRYLALHDAALIWARLNRALIAGAAAEVLSCGATLICDTVHNHVVAQDGLWLHRKGAAAADRGLVPLAGSREAPSFLLSVPDQVTTALGSVSHGAGRRYDRASMHGRIHKVKSDLAALNPRPLWRARGLPGPRSSDGGGWRHLQEPRDGGAQPGGLQSGVPGGAAGAADHLQDCGRRAMTERETLLVSSGNGPGECRQAVAHLLARLAGEVERLSLDLDVAERAAPHGPTSAVVVLTGPDAGALAQDWEGVVLWRCASSLRPRHPRKNWFAHSK